MALPTIYIDTGGATTNSGSSDNNAPDLDSVGTGLTVSVSGTTVTFSGAIDLSGVANDGSETIRIADATNANQKIFKITAVDDGANTVTVDVAPTGTISTSAWAIGGRFLASAGSYDTNLSAAVVAGWTVQFNNSPASHSGSDFITLRASGTNEAGFIKFIGLAGAKRTLTVTDANQCVGLASQSYVYFQNLEFINSSTGNAIDSITRATFYDCKFSDAGGANVSGTGIRLVNCELYGATADAVNGGTSGTVSTYGCYIHDVGDDGIQQGSNNPSMQILFTIFDTCLRGVNLTSASIGTSTVIICNNTFYGCGANGIITNDTTSGLEAVLFNNIFMNNGDAAGEYNIELLFNPGDEHLLHGYNVFHDGGAGENLLNLTAGATESTSDPLFADAANGNFALGSSSPGKATGFPGAFPGGLSTGYLDIGAVQRQEAGGATAKFLSSTLHPIGQGV
jgi:hypothetical protein